MRKSLLSATNDYLQLTVFSYKDYYLENGRASRDIGAIRRKFNSLVNFSKPTGDPTCPPDIKRAKEISRMINESVEISDVSDMDIVDFTEKQDDEGVDQQEESNSSAGSRHSRESSRASDTSRAGSEPPAAKRATVASEVPLSRKRKNKNITDSLVAFLDVEKKWEERDHKYDIIALHQSQIEHLRQALRDSKEDCRQRAEDLRQKFDEERIQNQRERTNLIAERERALQKVMVMELLNAKS
ncbi:uncharacterized protein V1513DRAFT_454428 [Lipomyces chichibuensis]|uniref:uncharacterized protein n=1 Tax=Lipomyces chichibuensis TaxID=1546026 RepID=UPI00334322EB